MRFRFNPYLEPGVTFEPADPAVLAFHASLPGYQPTPLHALPGLAASLGLANIFVKDESHRFGMNAFKGLGASWAMHRVRPKPAVFACATDGSHGRAVAWAARLAGSKAVVYVPKHMAQARQDAIRREGAEVVIVEGQYDDAVRRADADSKINGWQVIADTAYPGYMEIPAWVSEGYRTLFAEAERQIGELSILPPGLVILQAGVGGMAAAGALHFRQRDRSYRPALACVQPTASDCLVESIFSADGSPHETRGAQDSIMALLNCGMPSLLSWPVLRAAVKLFFSIDDRFAEEAVRRLYHSVGGDPRVVAGESGAAGLAGLIALCTAPEFAEAKEKIGISRGLSVVVIVTEGPSNPESFNKIISRRDAENAEKHI
jgi:diaminopropionate ammonia-lyase